jgi:hypothetical protein
MGGEYPPAAPTDAPPPSDYGINGFDEALLELLAAAEFG